MNYSKKHKKHMSDVMIYDGHGLMRWRTRGNAIYYFTIRKTFAKYKR